MTDLLLRVKKVYFDAIVSGSKRNEHREVTPYWRKRIEGRKYDTVTITCGYPKRNDLTKQVKFKYNGYSVGEIHHEHFGTGPILVYSIFLEPEDRLIGQTK